MSRRYMGLSGNVPIYDDNAALGVKTMHPNLAPELNAAIAKSEEDGGVWLRDVEVDTTLFVQTRNTLYTIEKRADGFYISGHPKYCPKPTKAVIQGSTFGGSVIKAGFIGIGMYLEYTTESHEFPIGTSRIISVFTSRILSVSELS